jgi:hypothetical protein
VWLRNMNMCLVFSVLHSRPTSLLSSNRVNVFFSEVFIYLLRNCIISHTQEADVSLHFCPS